MTDDRPGTACGSLADRDSVSAAGAVHRHPAAALRAAHLDAVQVYWGQPARPGDSRIMSETVFTDPTDPGNVSGPV